MPKLHLHGKSRLIAGVLFFLSIYFPVHGQSNYFDFESDTPYKWFFMQSWDTLSGNWGDTAMICQVTQSLNGKPVEAILKSDGSQEDIMKLVYNYQDGKVANGQIFTWEAENNNFSQAPSYQLNLVWQDEEMVKMVTENTLSFYPELAATLPEELHNVKLISETGYSFADGNILSDSTRSKVSGATAEALEEHSFLLKLYGIPADTNWVQTTRETYSWSGSTMIKIAESFDTESGELIFTSKDSILNENQKVTSIYNFFQDLNGDWELIGRAQYFYTGDSLRQTISQTLKDNEWVNSIRVVYHYTPYGTSVKSRSVASANSGIKADISGIRNNYILDLKLDQQTEFSVSLSDLSGRIVKRIANHSYLSGSHSIPIRVSTPGKYFCQITTKDKRTVVPFTVVQ
ncbi:MAG: T9SS type A sorting domain-containing protein [Fibrobacter sp.]|nr:T9SS type A sorting domain-containing protein [Fibrobacter sp.]